MVEVSLSINKIILYYLLTQTNRKQDTITRTLVQFTVMQFNNTVRNKSPYNCINKSENNNIGFTKLVLKLNLL